jgi:hypothetical protein
MEKEYQKRREKAIFLYIQKYVIFLTQTEVTERCCRKRIAGPGVHKTYDNGILGRRSSQVPVLGKTPVRWGVGNNPVLRSVDISVASVHLSSTIFEVRLKGPPPRF